MRKHVLLENGKVIQIQTLQSLTEAEIGSPLEQSKRNAFDRFTVTVNPSLQI